MALSPSMYLSFWEKETWFSSVDYLIVGSGIVGLNAALRIKKLYPSAKVLSIDAGILPHGASTRNAGFACFGSLSEIACDVKNAGEAFTISLIRKRWEGLNALRALTGDEAIDFRQNGGFELYGNEGNAESAMSLMPWLNRELKPIIGESVYADYSSRIKDFGFASTKRMSGTPYEGQVHTGKLMLTLQNLAAKEGIISLQNLKVNAFTDSTSGVHVELHNGITFKAGKVIVAVNGFASELLNMNEVQPARAQVLITRPLEKIPFRGCFHMDEGYYYFRDVGNRILFGGGRNLDFNGEKTTQTTTSETIQENLDRILCEIILPGQKPEIEMRWAGVMGIGETKLPIIKHLSENIVCAVRLGGMGVAIGTLTGREAAEKILD